ncbi:MAG: tail fiber domain-containing protein [Flavipsychrobacter sp.]
MKKLFLLGILACSLIAPELIAQTVNGSGTPSYHSKWTGSSTTTSTLSNAILWDDGTTVYLGPTPSPWFGGPTPWNFMYIQGTATNAGGRSVGINAELFDVSPSGTAQGIVMNVQNNRTNIGFNSYAANGVSSIAGLFAASASTEQQSNTVDGIRSTSTGNNNTTHAYGGDFTATNGIANSAVRATAQATNYTLYNTGVEAFATSNGFNARSFGIHASITNSSQGTATSTSTTGSFAGFFEASGAPNAAGYFNGNVWYTGALNSTSDKKFKENIKPIENAIDIITKLQSKTYTFKSDFKTFNFDEGNQFGFIAQDVEKVLPELVNKATNPARYDVNGIKTAEEVEFKAVEYVQLIPILTAGIQEQQAIIKSQNERIETLEDRLRKIEAGTTGINTNGNLLDGAELFQNVPNPFKGYTSISYRLPGNTTEAKIMIFDMNGSKIKQVQLEGQGQGKVDINATELSAGMYLYSLMINGAEVITKRMVVE